MACDVGMGGVSYHDMSSAFATVCETWHILDTEMESASVGIQVGETLVHTAAKCERKDGQAEKSIKHSLLGPHCRTLGNQS